VGEQHRRPPLCQQTIAVDQIVKEGDTIDVDGTSFDVLRTPGHSDCSISFHQPDEAVLIVSDATGYFLPDHHWWWPCYFTGYAAYVESMRRLAGLDAEILCLSHNAVVTGADDVKTYFAEVIAATEAYHARIVEQAHAGRSVREIAEGLGTEVYEKAPLLPLDFFQKNCALMVRQSLKHEGVDVGK
jgi:glyoxylase-like metal-dependent hydrolase (beta-lactamase superfamily II)